MKKALLLLIIGVIALISLITFLTYGHKRSVKIDKDVLLGRYKNHIEYLKTSYVDNFKEAGITIERQKDFHAEMFVARNDIIHASVSVENENGSFAGFGVFDSSSVSFDSLKSKEHLYSSVQYDEFGCAKVDITLMKSSETKTDYIHILCTGSQKGRKFEVILIVDKIAFDKVTKSQKSQEKEIPAKP